LADRANYIPTLDGLRAVAIAMVMISHATHFSHSILDPGYIGVMIFFALSGYLITTHLLHEQDASGRISLRSFYWRRAFRILPAAVLFLGVLAALSSAGLVICGWRAIRPALLFYANYADEHHRWAVGHFWSLSVEEHFYFVWPALLVAFGVTRGWITAAIVAVAISALRLLVDRGYVFQAVFQDTAHGNYHSDLFTDVILWGCVLAFYLHRSRRPAPSSVVSTALAIAAMALLVMPTTANLHLPKVVRNLLPAILLCAVVTAPRAPIGRFLELPPVRYIGRVSYSLYLWQQLFLADPERRLPLPVAVVLMCICAVLSYELIERPAIRFGHRLWQRWRPVPIAETIAR